jgi:hypothetical protein
MISRPRLLCALALALFATVLSPGAASAAGPALKVGSLIPEYVSPGKPMALWVYGQNVGDEPLAGNLQVKYTFPNGIVPEAPDEATANAENPLCVQVGQIEECELEAGGIAPGAMFVLRDFLQVEAGAAGVLTGQVEISGGGTGQTYTEPFSLDTGPADPFAVRTFDVAVDDASLYPSSQAGVTPNEQSTAVSFTSEAQTNLEFPNPTFTVTAPTESFRDVVVHVPPGLVGNPTATPIRCTGRQLSEQLMIGNALTNFSKCPAASQVGLVQIMNGEILPLFNMVPRVGVPAEFGFVYVGVRVFLQARVRSSDHGIDIVTKRAPSSVPIAKFNVKLWGVPADSSHDHLRNICLLGGFGYNSQSCIPQFAGDRNSFLRNPTSCTGAPLPWNIEVDTYQNPETFVSKETSTPAIEGCDRLPFDPSASVTPSDHSAHATSGFDVELAMPQEDAPDGLAEADLRSATVTLPQGVSINPAAADGLQACSDAQLGLGQDGPSQCPDASKIGSIELTTPLLEDPVGGSLFIRSQGSQDPASGDLYRVAMEIRSDRFGLAIKLPGSLKADPVTGQLTASFDDLPQLPFESAQLHLDSGPRAPLTTPSSCGTYTTHAVLTSWSGKTVPFDSNFQINQNCSAPGFAPGFQAGVERTTAGDFSPFLLRVTRDSGEPNLQRIEATLPEGELAKLAGVPVCSGAQAESGACPEGSRIGAVIAGVGEGTSPLYLPQPGKAPTSVYLAGPYKGAPYSIVTRVPAQSGPFDLGTVLVRSALRIDPETVQATVVSDPLPQIFGGIPVAYRDVRVEIDRPGFTLNPTDCEATKVTGTIGSAAGDSASVADRFQASDCAALGFKPKLSITLRGKAHRAAYPALTAVLQMPRGGANIARTSVALPHSEFLAQEHLGTSCTRVHYNAGAGGGAECPKASIYGRARAISPLLDKPLEGPVYLRSNGGARDLPDLVASLDGQIHVDLVGYVDSDPKTGGLRTTFAKVPDAPVSKFVLRMPGGKKGLLRNSTNICRGTHRAIVKMDAQNGRIADSRPLVRAQCGKGTS